MFVLAHLSDPHLPLPAPRWSELMGKRVTGYLNWQCRRRHVHRADVLATLVRDLKSQEIDHIAVTGDLTNISLEAEFVAARGFLASLGPPADVSYVPGNHDAYVRAATDFPARYWGPYMAGDAAGAAQPFPFLRRRSNVALIGVSTAVPTAPFMATGRLGERQLEGLARVLAALRAEAAAPFRVLIIHHPPVSGARSNKLLRDRADLLRVIAVYGAELVIHGHDHERSLVWVDGPDGRVPAIGVPSASAAPGMDHDPAGYNLYCIDAEGDGWRCVIEMRGLGTDGIMRPLGQQDYRCRVRRA